MSKLFSVSCESLGGSKALVLVHWSPMGNAMLDKIGDEGEYADLIQGVAWKLIEAASAAMEAKKCPAIRSRKR